MRYLLVISLVLLNLCSLSSIALATGRQGFRPDAGFVPDEATAIRIAEAVLIPIYGEKKVVSERPFSAKLKGHVWHVEGYLPPGAFGGVAEVSLDKRDGRILSVIHGK